MLRQKVRKGKEKVRRTGLNSRHTQVAVDKSIDVHREIERFKTFKDQIDICFPSWLRHFSAFSEPADFPFHRR